MHIEQIYTGCLSQGAYYIKDGKEAVIIDPLREVAPYLERAERDGVTIKYILETHFHADFVSGHVTLAEKTGAPIVYGPNANPSFEAHIAQDGEELKVGDLTIRVLHTPGHTLESTTYLLLNKEGQEEAIFTGDTLFLGDVGRPDLAQKGADLTQEDLAGMLYDSLRTKIMPLPDHVTVYPAHGAGSACGKKMMKQTVDKLGNQKEMNYALQANLSKAEFIEQVTDGLTEPPKYFPLNVKLNKQGYSSIDQILEQGDTALLPDELETVVNQQGALVLDVRTPADFAKGHIPNSIFIGLKGSFAPWVGELIIDVQQPLVLVVEQDNVKEAVTRLSRVGFDHTLGYLRGGMQAWKAAGKEVQTVQSVAPEAFAEAYPNNTARIFDVRKPTEYADAHVEQAQNTPLSNINDHLEDFPKEQPFYVHCAGGYRSMIAASILQARGIANPINVEGGFNKIKETTVPLV
jgi:glyoxylase-like metal-dependent hydrolase (beta-lactamase superfamily II)/rhodanese-related sulfurtransferase